MKSSRQGLNETLLNLADIDSSIQSIDLHGMNVHEAELEVDQFLSKMQFQKEQVVEIICGAGKGILADAIWEFVQGHPMVQAARSKGSKIYAVL